MGESRDNAPFRTETAQKRQGPSAVKLGECAKMCAEEWMGTDCIPILLQTCPAWCRSPQTIVDRNFAANKIAFEFCGQQ